MNVKCTVKTKTQCGPVAFFAGFAGTLQRAESTTPAQSTQECFPWTGTLAGVRALRKRCKHHCTKRRDTPPLWLIERVNFSLGRVRQKGWTAPTSFNVFTLVFILKLTQVSRTTMNCKYNCRSCKWLFKISYLLSVLLYEGFFFFSLLN